MSRKYQIHWTEWPVISLFKWNIDKNQSIQYINQLQIFLQKCQTRSISMRSSGVILSKYSFSKAKQTCFSYLLMRLCNFNISYFLQYWQQTISLLPQPSNPFLMGFVHQRLESHLFLDIVKYKETLKLLCTQNHA